jgi:invasion protein IalB
MIKNFVTDVALQMGVPITNVLMVDGYDGYDVNYLQIFSGGCLVSAFIRQPELDDLKKGLTGIEFELKIRNALTRLLIQQEP